MKALRRRAGKDVRPTIGLLSNILSFMLPIERRVQPPATWLPVRLPLSAMPLPSSAKAAASRASRRTVGRRSGLFPAALALCLALCLGAAPVMAGDALLRTHVLVEGDTVTLGDLFDNVGDKASAQVLRAPAAGQRITVDNDWLVHTAMINGIAWHPRDLFEESVIERAGVVIGRDQMLASLQEALVNQGAPADFLVEMDSHARPLVVPRGSDLKITVRDLFYDRDGNQFTATLAVGDATRATVNGRLYPTVQVPVLSRALARGEMIAAQDIAWNKIRQTELRATMLTDTAVIVGMSTKSQMRAGQTLAAGDLQKPIAVTRGALVTMVLNQGGMALTAQGRANDQGAIGDVIRVTNTHSNMTVEGTVDGTNHIRVTINGPVALAQ